MSAPRLDQLDLLSPSPITDRAVVRQAGDHEADGASRRRRRRVHSTSIEAHHAQDEMRTTNQQLVLEAFRFFGEMTDLELERKPVFAQWGASSARKRRSELFAAGVLEIARDEQGQPMKRDRALVWRIRRQP